MNNQRECVMAWSEEKNRLVRPVTNFTTNSWDYGSFTVGLTYEFKILHWNPESAHPHKSEDILVEEPAIPRDDQRLNESAMYEMLVHSSKTSVTDIFRSDAIKDKKYIDESTECPSAGVLRCEVSNIKIQNKYNFKGELQYRCEIFQDYDFSLTAQNRDSLEENLADCEPENRILVLLGLARPFSGTGNNNFQPRRCYIMVTGIIRAAQEQANESQPEDS